MTKFNPDRIHFHRHEWEYRDEDGSLTFSVEFWTMDGHIHINDLVTGDVITIEAPDEAEAIGRALITAADLVRQLNKEPVDEAQAQTP